MVRDQFHVPAELPPEKRHPYSFDRRLGRPHSRSGRFGEAVNALPLPRVKLRLLGCPALIPISIPLMLSNYKKLHAIRKHLPAESVVRGMAEEKQAVIEVESLENVNNKTR